MTADAFRPRRSVLYMPSSNARALEKARTLAADAIIFDLEDAVAPDAKELAREQAAAAVASRAYGGRELTIRCNGLDTPWGEADLQAAGAAAPDAVVIPKVSGVEHLDRVVALLPPGTRIWAMVETPTAVFDVRAIAAHPSVTALVLGTNDLAKELRAPLAPGRAALVPHLATAVLAAREAGIAVIDGVWNDVKDLDGFEAEARHGLALGFDGKTLIHPGQVEVANRVWAPDEDETAYARKVVEAFEQASQAGQGVVVVDGKMVENLHRDNALRTLAVAEAIAALG
ncbi:MAG: putative acyl-CoA lyase [Frankiales bacterium]|nr:putative acyl-CoA lyase [Frankiales bacterium]